MLIKLGYELAFELPAATPMMLLLHVHPSRQKDVRRETDLKVHPDTPVTTFTDCFGNRAARILAPAGLLMLSYDAIVNDSGLRDPVQPDARQLAVEDLPVDALQFLLNSRYCEVDELSDEAWKLFGHTPPGWPRVQAMVDWCHNNVEFGYAHANSTKSAADVYRDRKGVCRDFTHLAVTFCRCLNIPARYATGYLGDIGVPPVDLPMDFSAWFEVYLSGRWWTFDARHNTPRIGRVLMAQGRDATDCALTTSFGPAKLTKFVVWTDEVKED
jgi:transglutaminase-like putative cysteine protease